MDFPKSDQKMQHLNVSNKVIVVKRHIFELLCNNALMIILCRSWDLFQYSDRATGFMTDVRFLAETVISSPMHPDRLWAPILQWDLSLRVK